MLDAIRLRQLVDYDPVTGIFRWCVSTHGKRVGSRAGTVLQPHGSRRIRISGAVYAEHRLAWLHMTGEWPAQLIDHWNGDRADNRFANLREASPQQNSANTKRVKPNKWGFRGVKKRHGRRGFTAVIRDGGKRHYFGVFDTPAEAHAAYLAADKRLRGEFAVSADSLPPLGPLVVPLPPTRQPITPLTAERLREVVSYDPETGLFTWLVNGEQHKAAKRVGTIAGKLDANGYIRFFFDGHNIVAHRLVWLYLYGRLPSLVIDHRNGNRADNRLANLREVPHALNALNRSPNKGRILPRGVYRSGDKRWRATIMLGGKSRFLGCFATMEEAREAYASAAKAYFGEFARAS